MQIQSGPAGKAKAQFKAKGANLTLPALPLDQDSTVTAQLVGTNGFCVEANFSGPAKENSSDQFKDKAD